MIRDMNTVVGNALKEYIDFSISLSHGSGVVISVILFVRWHYRKDFYSQELVVDLEDETSLSIRDCLY